MVFVRLTVEEFIAMTKMLKPAEAASWNNVRATQKETALMDFHILPTIRKAANCAMKIKSQDSGVHQLINHMVSISNLTMVHTFMHVNVKFYN